MKHKSLFKTAVMAATVCSLVACSPKEEASTGNAGQEQSQTIKSNTNGDADGNNSEKTQITIWTVDRHDAPFMQSKVDEYNATNTDNIQVTYELYTENYEQAVDMAFQNGIGPDIIKFQERLFPKYVGSNKFVDLMPYLSEEQKETFGSAFYDGINLYGENLYYIPVTGTTGRLFYNKEIFETCGIDKVPETMDEMVAAAKKITSQLSGEGVYGFASNMKNPNAALGRSLGFMIQREAGINMGYDFAQGQYDFSKYQPMLESWQELMSPECAFPGCESLDIDPLRTQFAAGKIGMYISWTHAEPGVYKNQFPMDESKWGCALLPTMTGEIKGLQAFTPGNGMLLNADGKNIDAAWKVYESIWLNETIQAEYFEEGLGISIIPSVQEKAQLPSVYENNPALLIGSEDGLWPLSPIEIDSSAMVVEGMDAYSTFGAMIWGEKDIESGLVDLTARHNKAYKKAIDSGELKAVKIDGFDPMNPLS